MRISETGMGRLISRLQAKGQELASHPSVEKLPKVIRGALLTGWFEGSAFFAILGEFMHDMPTN
jgi:hypothetical protein